MREDQRDELDSTMWRPDEISRVTRPRKEAGVIYDKLATWYHLLIDRLEHGCSKVGFTKLKVREGESVLEVGFGVGSSIVAMAEAVGSCGKLVGIDLSKRMVATARARVSSAGLSSRVELIRSDAVDVPFQDNTFDAVFMSYVLELFDTPEIPIVLSECLRLLRPEGRICVVALSKEGRKSLAKRLYELGHRFLPRYLDCRPIYALRSLEAAGFNIENIELCSLFGLDVEIILASKPAG
jgi:demethylmenaquinone methyltransferase/2-methoxy-6-polyprenyl-1,4-benzoquinol methylase